MKKLMCLVFAAMAVCAGVANEVKSPDGMWDIRKGIPNSLLAFKNDRSGYQYIFPVGDWHAANANKMFKHHQRLLKEVKKRFGGNPILRPYYIEDSWFAQYKPGGRFTSGHFLVLDLGYAVKAFEANPDKAAVELEVLLRQTRLFNPRSSRMLVYPADEKLVAEYKKGAIPDLVKRAEEIAAHYGIPTLNLALSAAKGVELGKTTDEFLNALLSMPVPAKFDTSKDPVKLNPAVNNSCRVIAYDDGAVRKKGKWQFGCKSPIKAFLHVLTCEGEGNELEMEFRGTEIGLTDVVCKDSAVLEWSIDGGAWNRLEPESLESGKFKQRNVVLASGLKYDETSGTKQERSDRHVIRLRSASKGCVYFYGFLLNGSVADEGFASVNTIEYIDKVYSEMKKVNFTPVKNRFDNIPKTIEKLKTGPELRIVMLGDSIINDTASSQYELLLMRKYPKCKVTKIRSVRGSTGCWYYAKENRVQEWVLNHKPDLLIIGGISNRDDADSVRSVVQQVKKANPAIEIMLVTPVFGNPAYKYNASWTYEIDAEKYPFRAQMRDIAKEEKCAFFDMTAEWKKYVNESGCDVGWFMRDAVHANARGSQILGRLLEIWFDVAK